MKYFLALTQRSLRLCLGALCLSSTACGGEPSKPAPNSLKIEAPSIPASTQVASVPSSVPSPSLQDITVRDLKEVLAEPFATKAIQEGTPIFSGENFLVVNGSSSPPRLIAGVSKKPGEKPETYGLLDPDSGTKLAEFSRASMISEKAGVFVASDGTQQRLIRLSDGSSPNLQATLPDGTSAKEIGLFVNVLGADIWVFGKDAADNSYYAQWRDLSTEKLSLTPFPFDPNYYINNVATRTLEVAPKTPEESSECAKIRLHPEKEPQCLFKKSDLLPETSYLGGSVWVDLHQSVGADYVFLGDQFRNNGRDTALFSIATKERIGLPEEFEPCSWAPYTYLEEPPRVLGTSYNCEEKDKNKQFIFLWSPEKVFLWSPRKGSIRNSWNSVKEPILPLRDEDLSILWIDLERGVVFNTPPLNPLEISSQERLALALRPEGGKVPAKNNDLLLLDFDAGSYSQIAKLAPCKGEIFELQRGGQRHEIACMTSSGEGLFPSVVQWVEIIDLKAKTRYQTKLTVERMFNDGAVSLSNRKEIGEGYDTATKLYYLPSL